VLESCSRDGSSDKKIKNETFNEFDPLFNNYPNLKRLFFNGLNSYILFYKHPYRVINFASPMILSSTSPLNTHLTIEEKIEKWSIIKNALD
jgi:hypoxanthine-DNA glycosylase